ncbi:MAG TPA: hypothetical protein VFU82_04750 [Gammaproteobacteria bacterium]|jgi:hypothetical protein|nr:hypothetical protein [Gammaproteobacteria bacterium]
MKPSTQKPEKQNDEDKKLLQMQIYGAALRGEYAVSTNPNTTFAQKPAKQMTQNEAVTYYLNT